MRFSKEDVDAMQARVKASLTKQITDAVSSLIPAEKISPGMKRLIKAVNAPPKTATEAVMEDRHAMLTFMVPGQPVPKGRPRVLKNGQTYTDKRTREAEKAIGFAAKTALIQQRRNRPLTGPLSLTVYFHLKNRRRMDVDNLLKTVQDGLNGVAFEDDSQIVEVHAYKRMSCMDPRTGVCIQAADEV